MTTVDDDEIWWCVQASDCVCEMNVCLYIFVRRWIFFGVLVRENRN